MGVHLEWLRLAAKRGEKVKIFMLCGWGSSDGARIELAAAQIFGFGIVG